MTTAALLASPRKAKRCIWLAVMTPTLYACCPSTSGGTETMMAEDPQYKVAILGISFGEYATLIGLTSTPEVCMAGVDLGRSVANFLNHTILWNL
jgi:hypothetical protein